MSEKSQPQLIKEINDLIAKQEYDAALRIIEDAEYMLGTDLAEFQPLPFPPSVYVLKSLCIQLASDNSAFEMEDAKDCLYKSLELDPLCIKALYELGYHYITVDEDIESATEVFRKILQICRTFQKNASKALVECKKHAEFDNAILDEFEPNQILSVFVYNLADDGIIKLKQTLHESENKGCFFTISKELSRVIIKLAPANNIKSFLNFDWKPFQKPDRNKGICVDESQIKNNRINVFL